MVTVYRIVPDYSYQGLNPTGDEFGSKYAVRPVGVSLAEGWSPLRMYVDDSLLRRGSFLAVTSDLYAIDAEIAKSLHPILDRFGELLPIEIEGVKERFYLWNVTTTFDALDDGSTEFEPVASGRGLPKVNKFRPEAVCRPAVFKVPSLPETMLFVSTTDKTMDTSDTSLDLMLLITF